MLIELTIDYGKVGIKSFDNGGWNRKKQPKPPEAFSTADYMKGFSANCNKVDFWYEAGGYLWKWKEATKKWQIDKSIDKSIVFDRSEAPYGHKLFKLGTIQGLPFVVLRFNPLMHKNISELFDDETDKIFIKKDKWIELKLLNASKYNVKDIVILSDKTYFNSRNGRLFEVTANGIKEMETPGICEAITKSSIDNLLISIKDKGIYEYKENWELLYDYPVSSEERSFIHTTFLAELNGNFCFIVSPTLVDITVGGGPYKFKYPCKARIWLTNQKNKKVLVEVLLKRE